MTAEHDRDRQRKRQQRAADREVEIPAVVDAARRARCQDDVLEFLSTYLGHWFDGPWTADRRAMVEAIVHRASFGGDQAIAAPRGDGKSTITRGVLLWLLMTGRVGFAVLVNATKEDAVRSLEALKAELEDNATLAEDWPEVCAPIVALERNARRAAQQTCGGEYTHIRWSGDLIVLPAIRGSVASGAVLASKSIDGSIRGLNYKARRPDFVVLDDVDTEESARSETQTEARIKAIDRAIGGLAGPGKTLARVMLCTCLNRRCVAWIYTDRKQRPSWSGLRLRQLVTPPERTDLWDEYQLLRQQAQQAGDVDGRAATRYYLAHRATMDAGATLSNPSRLVTKPHDDGAPVDASALEHVYKVICDRGLEAFQTEYQNDPPEDETPTQSSLTAYQIQTRLSGLAWCEVPAGAVCVTLGIDVGADYCHYVAAAWQPRAIGHVIDRGVIEVLGRDTLGLEQAILHALSGFADRIKAEQPYRTAGGELVPIAAALVDSGWKARDWRDHPVYAFVRQAGPPYRASKGFGASTKGAERFRQVKPDRKTKWAGDGWWITRQPSGLYLYGVDVDQWKRWIHERFTTTPGQPGSLVLFGSDPREHMSYAKHLTAEVLEYVPGESPRWKQRHHNNHYLDATVLACVGADMSGIRLLAPPPATSAAASAPAARSVAAERDADSRSPVRRQLNRRTLTRRGR